jgi:VWFA-related protein
MSRTHRAALLSLLAMTVAAQQDPSAPTFSSSTKLVQVDVVARSKDAPATGLTKEDFTLLDNGKLQKISFFSVRSARSIGTAGSPSAPAAIPLPAGAVSNRLERGGNALANATVLLIDQFNTPPAVQAFAIQRVAKFLQMHRGGDRIGIYTYSIDGLQAVQEITGDAELLSRAAKGLKARNLIRRSHDTAGMTAHQAEGHGALETAEAASGFQGVLEEVARHLARAPGRKTLIWVSTSFPLFFPPPPEPPILDYRKEMEAGARALNDANVALYAVDARGLQGALSGLTAVSNAETGGARSPAQLRQQMGRGEAISPDGLITEQFLAGLTGGLVFYNRSNAIEESIQTAVDDGELIYTLGFYPAQESQDGSLHNLKVEVARPGVSLRYRKNYFVSKTGGAANERPTLEALLKDPLDATQLELVAAASADPARPGSWQVHVTVDLHDVQLERRDDIWVGTVDVSFLVEGTGGYRTLSKRVEIPDDQLAAFVEKGMVFNDSIEGNAQSGVLRVVAQDRANGAAGSVRVPLGRK